MFMALIGSTIKKLLKFKADYLGGRKSPQEAQKQQLMELLEKAISTSFGKYYHFESILNSSDPESLFKNRLPIVHYEEMNDRWWFQQQRFPDITWPGQPEYYALSSGTTGPSSKRLPVTEDFLRSMRLVSLDQLSEISKLELPEEVFESEALAISSSANLERRKGNYEGEISGININNLPDWYELFFRPGKEIAAIDDWETRTDRIADEAVQWNIGLISGIPSWVQLCLQKIIDRQGVEYVDDLWPNARVFISGGVAFDTYENSFRALFRKELTVIDTYLASEGFFAYGSADSPMEMKLTTRHGYYFEFVPFTGEYIDEKGQVKPGAPTIGLDQVEKDKEYVLVASTCAGAWRYVPGDTVTFTSTDPPKIVLTGRIKFFLNVVGSQLSEQKINAAIRHLSAQLDEDINEFMVTCKEIDEKYYHVWTLVNSKELPLEKAAAELDQYLKEANKNYKVARSKALAGVICRRLDPAQYRNYLEKQNKLGGQVKIQKVMSPEKNKKFEEQLDWN